MEPPWCSSSPTSWLLGKAATVTAGGPSVTVGRHGRYHDIPNAKMPSVPRFRQSRQGPRPGVNLTFTTYPEARNSESAWTGDWRCRIADRDFKFAPVIDSTRSANGSSGISAKLQKCASAVKLRLAIPKKRLTALAGSWTCSHRGSGSSSSGCSTRDNGQVLSFGGRSWYSRRSLEWLARNVPAGRSVAAAHSPVEAKRQLPPHAFCGIPGPLESPAPELPLPEAS